MKKDKDYLKKHNMEWNNGQVRQLPGRYNSLGLVKFMFPNSNDIYLHDSPAKSLFKKEDRAKSHGCVRVGMARDLALSLLQDDENWTPQKLMPPCVPAKETNIALKGNPVYIGYLPPGWMKMDISIFTKTFITEMRDWPNYLCKGITKL